MDFCYSCYGSIGLTLHFISINLEYTWTSLVKESERRLTISTYSNGPGFGFQRRQNWKTIWNSMAVPRRECAWQHSFSEVGCVEPKRVNMVCCCKHDTTHSTLCTTSYYTWSFRMNNETIEKKNILVFVCLPLSLLTVMFSFVMVYSSAVFLTVLSKNSINFIYIHWSSPSFSSSFVCHCGCW